MIKKEKKIVVTFFTTAEAMATEKACKEAKLEGKLISAPRELTADCGISFSCDIKDRENIEKLLNGKSIEFDKIVEIEV